jgi:hypothetical protein
MAKLSKEEILSAIKQTASMGKPLGYRTFRKETGITQYEWGRYWSKFTEAQKEAGFEPNSPNLAFEQGYAEEKFIELIRKLRKFPTIGEIRVERSSDPEIPKFPSKKIATTLALAKKLFDYSTGRDGYDDILEICKLKMDNIVESDELEQKGSNHILGEVYLYKSGHNYKIGKTGNLIRRGKELRLLLADEPIHIHSIKTDDPAGVEVYWQKRFESKRKGNSEFFTLNADDVRAFKRWRRIH